jgi:hypothetical protein
MCERLLLRGCSIALLSLLGWAAAASPAWAGLYSTEKPPSDYPVPRGGVKDIPAVDFQATFLPDLRKISMVPRQQPGVSDRVPKGDDPVAKTLRERYEDRRDDLLHQGHRGRLTVDDRVNLSYYLIRLGQLDKALEVLNDLEAQRSGNFMVYANLGTIYEIQGNAGAPSDRANSLSQALKMLGIARFSWPRGGWPGWSKDQLAWFKKAEDYNYALVRQRFQEAKKQTTEKDDRPFNNVDSLFPLNWQRDRKEPLRFGGTNGAYQVGALAAAERAKLIGDERGIVQQLLTWLPNDDRLYWLWGEILNAEGDTATAAKIFEELVWSRNLSNIPVLRQHRSLVKESLIKPEPTWLERYGYYLLIGIGSGLVVGLLGFLQLREYRRRRR